MRSLPGAVTPLAPASQPSEAGVLEPPQLVVESLQIRFEDGRLAPELAQALAAEAVAALGRPGSASAPAEAIAEAIRSALRARGLWSRR